MDKVEDRWGGEVHKQNLMRCDVALLDYIDAESILTKILLHINPEYAICTHL